jgi:hypothetical protein
MVLHMYELEPTVLSPEELAAAARLQRYVESKVPREVLDADGDGGTRYSLPEEPFLPGLCVEFVMENDPEAATDAPYFQPGPHDTPSFHLCFRTADVNIYTANKYENGIALFDADNREIIGDTATGVNAVIDKLEELEASGQMQFVAQVEM